MTALPLIRAGDVTDAERRALAEGAVVVEHDGTARFLLTGDGRVACLQGLITADVAKAERDYLFGALLTAKGMIVTPLWVTLRPDAIHVEAPGAAAAALEDVFKRTLPPRLCRWENVTAGTISFGVYGPRASAFPGARAAIARGVTGFDGADAGDAATLVMKEAIAGGAVRGSAALMETCRIEAGLPKLGAEIDERTLPQEVRYEELGAISYTKGCYIGQETVARLHFRGHANRRVVQLSLGAEPAKLPAELALEGRTVGRLTSAAWSDLVDGWVGLGVMRRDVVDDAVLTVAGGGDAAVRADRWLRSA